MNKTAFTMRLPQELAEKMKALGKKNTRSMTQEIEVAIRQYIERNEDEQASTSQLSK